VRRTQRIVPIVVRTALTLAVLALLTIVGTIAVVHFLVSGPKTNTLNGRPIDPSMSASVGSPPVSASGNARLGPRGSPKPSASGSRRTAAGPPASGFPEASNTGVPQGFALKRMKGDLVIRQSGTVIDGINLVGKVVVQANNVTIKRSRITAPTDLPNKGRDEFTVIQQYTSAKGLRLEDCEIDGSNLVYRAVMGTDGVTVDRCELKNIGHGVEVGDNYVVENSWIHSTTDGPDHDWHVDGVISSAGVNGVIRHNTIVLTGNGVTGAVSVGSSLGRIDNVVVQNNLLAGGNYTIYVQDQGNPATRIRVLDNQFSTMVEPKVGVYGIWYPNDVPDDLVRRGNKIHETGAPADSEPDWG
jgi:hypothetical protein